VTLDVRLAVLQLGGIALLGVTQVVELVLDAEREIAREGAFGADASAPKNALRSLIEPRTLKSPYCIAKNTPTNAAPIAANASTTIRFRKRTRD